MVIQIDGNPWVYPPKDITQHPGSQSDDQTEWLDILRNYIHKNFSMIQNAIDSDTDAQQMSLVDSYPSVQSCPSLKSTNSGVSISGSDSTLPLSTSSLAPINTDSVPISPKATTSFRSLATPSTSNPHSPIVSYSNISSLSNVQIHPTTSLPNSTFTNDQTSSEPDSLWMQPKKTQAFSANFDQQPKNRSRSNTLEYHDLAEKNRSNDDIRFSRAAKRMGVVSKRPSRADSFDNMSSQLLASTKTFGEINGLTPGGPATFASSALSTHEEGIKSSSAGPDASILSDNSNLVSSPSSENHTAFPNPNNSTDPPLSNTSTMPLNPQSASKTKTNTDNSQIPRESEPGQAMKSSSTTSLNSSEKNTSLTYPNTPLQSDSSFPSPSSASADDQPHSRYSNLSANLAPPQIQSIGKTGRSSSAGTPFQMPSSKTVVPNAKLLRERSYSVSATLPADRDSTSGEQFKWLSTVNEEMKPLVSSNTINLLPQKSKEAKEILKLHRNTIIVARDILFSLVEFHSIMRRCTRLCNDKAITAEMHTILYTCQSYNEKLVKMLEREEFRLNTTLGNHSSKKDPDDELKSSKASIKLIASACVASIRNFKQMVNFCDANLAKFTAAVDVKFLRCIILVIFGSFNELFNSWNVLNEIEYPLSYGNSAQPSHTPWQASEALSSTYIAAGLDNLPLPHSSVDHSSLHESSPTTPSHSPLTASFFQRGSVSSNGSPSSASTSGLGTIFSESASTIFTSFAEPDEQLYRGLEAATTAAKILLKQLTETLTKTGKEMTDAQLIARQQNSQLAISNNVKTHVRNLSEKCQTGVAVTRQLKQQLDVIRKTKRGASPAEGNYSTHGSDTSINTPNSSSTSLTSGAVPFDRGQFWEDMNSFVKGMIGLLTSTKKAIDYMPYLKNASNLATLTKLTKDIPPLMEASSYQMLVSEAKGREHSNSVSAQGTNLQPGSSKNHPIQITLPSYSNLASMMAGPASVSGQSHNFSGVGTGPATTTAVPLSNPFDHAAAGTLPSTQTTNISYYPNNYSNAQLSAPPSTPLAAVLGTTAAALVLPSPPIGKKYAHSPFFPPMEASSGAGGSSEMGSHGLMSVSSMANIPLGEGNKASSMSSTSPQKSYSSIGLSTSMAGDGGLNFSARGGSSKTSLSNTLSASAKNKGKDAESMVSSDDSLSGTNNSTSTASGKTGGVPEKKVANSEEMKEGLANISISEKDGHNVDNCEAQHDNK